MRPRLSLLASAALLVASFAAACGDGESAEDGGRLRVVVSTGVIAEFAARVAGPDAEVRTLIPPGVDLHSFEPSPGVARAIAEADLVFVNGYALEESLLDLIEENVSGSAQIVVVSAGLAVLEGARDEAVRDGLIRAEGDPHLWLAVPNAIGYVEAIRDALVVSDAEHADAYSDRADALVEELEALDAELHALLDGLVAEERRLVVFHDAFAYLAAEYGFEVVASVLPANPNQDPSAGAVAEVIAVVEQSGVRTVFREPQFSSPVLDVIADEAGVEVATLHSTLDDEVPSYAELMRANARALFEGLSH